MKHNILKLPIAIKLLYELCTYKAKSSTTLDLMDILVDYRPYIITKIPLNHGIRVDIEESTVFMFVKNSTLSCSLINTTLLESRENLILTIAKECENSEELKLKLQKLKLFHNLNFSSMTEGFYVLVKLPYVTYRVNLNKQSMSYA